MLLETFPRGHGWVEGDTVIVQRESVSRRGILPRGQAAGSRFYRQAGCSVCS